MASIVAAPARLSQALFNLPKYRALSNKYKEHLRTANPELHVRDTTQIFNFWISAYVADETKRLRVDENLPFTRAEFSEYLELKEDVERLTGPATLTALAGGLPLLALPFWSLHSNRHNHPSSFFKTEDEKIDAWTHRDQEVHLKHAPICNFTQQRYIEYYIAGEPRFNEAFDAISSGFTEIHNGHGAAIRKLGQHVHRNETVHVGLITSDISSWVRGRELYEAQAFLGKSFFGLGTEALVSRTIDHYRSLYQEDVLIKKEGLSSLDDFTLYRICNRRLIARWEEKLSRAKLEARLNDWFTLTEITTPEEHVPLRIVLLYQTAHFREPGFLDQDISVLDEDALSNTRTWAADAFQRRIAFENSAVADQVQVHNIAQAESYAKALEERTAWVAAHGAAPAVQEKAATA